MSYLSKRCLKADLAIIGRRRELSFLKLAKLIINCSLAVIKSFYMFLEESQLGVRPSHF